MNISSLNKKQIDKEIFKCIDILNEIEAKNTIIVRNGSPVQVTNSLIQQLVFKREDSPVFNRVLKPAILSECISAEMLCGGSGDLCLLLISEILKTVSKTYKPNAILKDFNYNKIYQQISSEIKKIGRYPDQRDFNVFIKQEVSDQKIREILKVSLNLSGVRSNIFTEISNSQDTSISCQSGYNFSLPINGKFLNLGKWKRKNLKCVVIDGTILEVSEIHHLLQISSDSKEPIVIFCRKISPDVLNTIYVNFSRKTIDVFPIEVGLDENTINILNDISIVTGCDMISTHKGDLISTAVRHGLKTIDEIEIGEKSVSIINDSNKAQVSSHLKYLKKKRDDVEEVLRELFVKRIRGMSSDRVIIKIGQEDLKKNPTCLEEIDHFLRSLKPFDNQGCMDISNLNKKIKMIDRQDNFENSIFNAIHRALETFSKKIMGASPACMALKTALSSVESLQSSEIILLEDR